ncbi:MAG: hypothetical protein KKD44_00165 [Proteobacteria bacterium]|nr:hypothetical protein [Pseudomonadota bacterium]
MLKLIKKTLVVVLMCLLCHVYLFPLDSEAKTNTASDNIDIETPQSRLSPEIMMPSATGSNISQWIVNHKWWVLIGLSVVTVGAVLLSNSGNSSSDDNIINPDPNNGFGQISAEW